MTTTTYTPIKPTEGTHEATNEHKPFDGTNDLIDYVTSSLRNYAVYRNLTAVGASSDNHDQTYQHESFIDTFNDTFVEGKITENGKDERTKKIKQKNPFTPLSSDELISLYDNLYGTDLSQYEGLDIEDITDQLSATDQPFTPGLNNSPWPIPYRLIFVGGSSDKCYPDHDIYCYVLIIGKTNASPEKVVSIEYGKGSISQYELLDLLYTVYERQRETTRNNERQKINSENN